MDVDDSVGELINKIGRNLRQETSEDDEVTSTNSLYHESRFIKELLPCNDGSGYPQLFGAYQGISITAAGHDNRNLHIWFIGEVTDDVFAVSAASCDEDGEFNRFAHGLIIVLILFGKVESLQIRCPLSQVPSLQQP